jgi:hypothetical protein
MFGRQAIPIFIAICIIGVFVEIPAHAADLTLSAVRFPARSAPPKAVPVKRTEKRRHRGIIAYRLYDDPAFKLRGAMTEKPHFLVTDRITSSAYFGSATGPWTAAGSAKPGAASTAGRIDNDESMAVNCWTQAPDRLPRVRNLTACYQQPVDKGWRAQTYVSRGSAGGRSDWGGGVALSYAD